MMFVAEPPEVDKAKEIIKKMTFNYESNTFENPGQYYEDGLLSSYAS